MPSEAPVQMASMPLTDSFSTWAGAPRRVGLISFSGRRILAIIRAAGALMTEAVRRWPAEMPKAT